MPTGSGYLHVSFHRENPTRLTSDLVITEGMAGPGRFLGCSLASGSSARASGTGRAR